MAYLLGDYVRINQTVPDEQLSDELQEARDRKEVGRIMGRAKKNNNVLVVAFTGEFIEPCSAEFFAEELIPVAFDDLEK